MRNAPPSSSHEAFATNDSCKISKYKKLAEDATYLGEWDEFKICMRNERHRWEEQRTSSSQPKMRAFRWAEIVEFVNKRARERKLNE